MQDTLDSAVTITEVDGVISIEVRLAATIQIPRELMTDHQADPGEVAKMIAEAATVDIDLDLVPAIENKLRAHLSVVDLSSDAPLVKGL